MGRGLMKALDSKQSWAQWMLEPAAKLVKCLANTSEHPCDICAYVMCRGADDHLRGQHHWKQICKKLGEKYADRRPTDDAAGVGSNNAWVQVFKEDGGKR